MSALLPPTKLLLKAPQPVLIQSALSSSSFNPEAVPASFEQSVAAPGNEQAKGEFFNSCLFFGAESKIQSSIWSNHFPVSNSSPGARPSAAEGGTEFSKSTNESTQSAQSEDLNSGSSLQNKSFHSAKEEKPESDRESIKAQEDMIGDDLLKLIDNQSAHSEENDSS